MTKNSKATTAILHVVEEVREIYAPSPTVKRLVDGASDSNLLLVELAVSAAINEVISAYEQRLAELVPIPGVEPLVREEPEEEAEQYPSGRVPVDLYLSK